MVTYKIKKDLTKKDKNHAVIQSHSFRHHSSRWGFRLRIRLLQVTQAGNQAGQGQRLGRPRSLGQC